MESDILVILGRILFVGIFVGIWVLSKKANKVKEVKYEQIESKYSYLVDKLINVLANDEELNKERAVSKKVRACGIIVLIIGIIVLIFCTNIHPKFVAIAFLLIILAFSIFNYKNEHYREIFKNKVISKTLNEFDSSLYYDKNGGFPRSVYTDATIGSFDKYHSEDKIVGTVDDCEFLIADVSTFKKRVDDDGKTYYEPSFIGQAALLYLPTSFNFDLIISDNTLKIYDYNYIEIDNPEFENYFDVSSTNRLVAMKILTPAVTTKLLELKNNYGFVFEMRILNNVMVFRFRTDNLFEPNPLNVRKEAIKIVRYFEIINGMRDVMHEVLEALKKA